MALPLTVVDTTVIIDILRGSQPVASPGAPPIGLSEIVTDA